MTRALALLALALTLMGCNPLLQRVILPEERDYHIRESTSLPQAEVPRTPPPRTVADPQPDAPEWRLSLDECIRIALVNGQVVRVLTGFSAQSSGRTIYDAAITAANIDQAQARFDPRVEHRQSVNHTEVPQAFFNALARAGVLLDATPTDDYSSEARLAKTNVLGGEWLARWVENPLRSRAGPFSASPFPLNPQNRSLWELGYTQPLWQNAGFAVNTAPIVIARIDTERSFFQYKDAVQELVRGVIEAYWQLVQAKTEVWARQYQVDSSKAAYEREVARLKVGLGDRSDESQARLTYNQFRSSLVAARATLLAREGALRNLLGLPASDGKAIVPTSIPTAKPYRPDWKEILRLAEERRPDLVELKLILEADQVRMIQAENLATPKLDAYGLYRWNGLSGEAPNGERIESGAGQFTDWTIGVNFSVPLGLREGRARARQQRLLIERDIANLEQGLHLAGHSLAIVVRDLDGAYMQYEALRDTREAAEANLRVQMAARGVGRKIYLDELRALTAWGDAVNAESAALLTYNVQLANLERETGTILETHGLVFNEERLRAAGPLGIAKKLYPGAISVQGLPERYPGGSPRANSLGLERPQITPPRIPGVLPPPREH
jgi:outer membrane protein TolC